jgi:hypothetical protein
MIEPSHSENLATAMAETKNPELRSSLDQAVELADRYENFVVTSADDYILAAEDLRDVKTRLETINEKRFGITRPMDAAKKAVMNLFAPPTTALELCEKRIKKGMCDYDVRQEQIAEETRRAEAERQRREAEKLQREADERREAAAAKERERLRLERVEADRKANIERVRIEAEEALLAVQREKAAAAQKKIDDAKAEADAAERAELDRQEAKLAEEKAARDAEELRLAEEKKTREREAEEERERIHQQTIAAAAAAQESARADTLEARAQNTSTAPIASKAPKVKGVSGGKTWKAEIVDVDKIPRKYLTPDTKKINAVAKALKADADIPGIRIYWEPKISAKRS